ncbi:uncharacterized protein LOC128348054 [Hemicordylus capensis]|uniref:uncharacterized protein LOC128348054 n=1 Tax=Hemicordylus capensis TaxID=884348 RepID=UPI0023027FDC|nr:uncharacterized protein LOC128348054 [Hemicordylus capensis]
MDAIQNYCYFASCWDLCFLLSSTIVLTLLTCLARKILHGSFLWDGRGSQLWERSQAGPPRCTDLHSRTQQMMLYEALEIWGKTELESQGWLQADAGEREDHESAKASLASQSKGWVGQNESLCCSSSDVSEASFSSRTDYSSSSGQSNGSLQSWIDSGHQEVILQQEAFYEHSLQIESEVSSKSEGETGQEKQDIFPNGRKHLPSSCRGTTPGRHHGRRGRTGQRSILTSLGTQKLPRMTFPAMDTPFVPEAVRAALERHLVAKRVQHNIGLSRVLLRSIWSLMPLASVSISGKPVKGTAAVTRPHSLSFLSVDSKTRLEKQLKKMVHLKCWGLPRRVQEAVKHMDFHPRTPGSAHAIGKENQRTGKAQQQAKDMAFRSACACRSSLPEPGQHSQKMAAAKARKVAFLQAQSCPPPSSRQSLRKKGERVVLMSNKVPFQGAQSTHPLATVIPSAPPWMPPTAESGSAQLGVPTHLEVLESHILRKRLQHQWGLPSLTQRSLCRFLPAPPPSTARPDSPWCAQLKENTLPVTNQLTFIPLGTKKLLENHLKRMIVERQWGLPKRVKESLRGFIPVSAPLTKRPREGEKAPLSPELRRPKMKGPPPKKASSPPERPAGCSERRPLQGLCEWKQGMAGPLAKKALKIQLDFLSHREITHQAEKSSLPKVLPPGLKGVRLRSQQLPFVEHDILDRIQFNIKHKQLAHRWGLPTLYSKSVACLFHGTAPPAPDHLLPAEATTVRFSAAETLFIAKGIREKLEWHVKRKRLQHAWGLPDLVQRSLRQLLPAVPLQCRQKPGLRNVIVLPDQLSFLSKETTHKLNRNVLKRVVLQRWGLPSRVLQSLRLLCPEMGFGSPGRNASKPHQALSDSIRGDFPGPSAVSGDRRIRSRRTAVAPHRVPLPCPMLGPEELEKMEHHLAKKSVEVQLGAFPPLSRFSWRLVLLSTKQLLPRLICPSQRSLQLRSGFLPFVPPDDVVRLELSVCRRHLASLWELGLRYVEALGGMVPKPRPVSLPPRRTGIEFTEVHIIFLPQPAKDALEVHIQKKRLQHLWGVPALIRRSLEAFMQGFPQLPSRQSTEVHVSTMRQELSFLPCSVCSHLELHVQKTKLHRQWGLPRRVLASLKCLCPEAGSLALRQKVARAPFGLLHSGGGSPPELWSVGTVSMGPGTRKAERIVGDATPQPLPPEWSVGTVSMGPGTRKAKRIVGDATPQPLPPESWSVGTVSTGPGTKKAERMVRTAASQPLPSILAAKDLEKVKLRLARKCVEVQLGALPAMVKLSWRRAALSSRQPLPQLILPGRRALQPRRHFLTFARREDVERMELAVQHNHLISLWGLGVSYVEALGVMMPKPPLQPPRRRTTAFRFLDMKTPFLREQEREALELHVKKKKIQHMWGLPVLIQRSLLCFTHRTPSVHICHKAKIVVRIEHLQPSFISEGICRSLELHIQKMKLQRLWRLPGRVREALKGFVPSSSLVIMGRDSRPQRSILTTQNLLRFTEGLNFTEEMRGRDKPGADVRQRAEDEEEVQLEESQVCGGETSTEESTSGKGISTGCSIGPVSISHEEKEMDVSWKFRKEDAAPYPASRVQLVTMESKAPLTAKKMTSAGNEPLRMMRSQSEGGGERVRQPQFLLKGDSMLPVPHKAIDKKLSLIGSILEKKLYLKHGLQAWLRNQERERKLGTISQEKLVVSKERRSSSKERRSSSKERRSSSKERRSSSKERRSSSKERRSSSKERRSSSKERRSSSKERRSSSKERRSSSKERRSSSKERRSSSKERRSSSKERRSSSKERRSSSKERRSSSKERRLIRKRSSSKDDRSSTSKRSSRSKRRTTARNQTPRPSGITYQSPQLCRL